MPDGLPYDAISRGRQIVITQPRRGATIDITGFVGGTLHGADIGIGHEIGYRVRGDHACDQRNRMVYVTDGTLINWIVRGELDRISLIILDEAHERSLNIDVILALLADRLPQYPHLKLLIVSATINHKKFQQFFNTRLPGGLQCGIIQCSGSKPKGLTIHYRNDSVRPYPYGTGPLRTFGKEVWQNLADAMLELIDEMHNPGRCPNRKVERGDILGFLHGAKPIQDACDHIRRRLKADFPQIAKQTDVFALYADVDPKEREKAVGDKQDPERLRVVIASNAAETSLTIDSLKHVVDSGFIKQTQWDPEIMEAPLNPIAHSRAGCKQRWGRVGRTDEGFAWTLYTRSQFFNQFREDTVPEIQRSFLDGVLLQAKRAGADRLEERFFPWLDAPDASEIQRSLQRLTKQAALDEDGDLTQNGLNAAASGGEDLQYARVIADADRFGFAIEIGTLIPFLKEGYKDLFPQGSDLPAGEVSLMAGAQTRLRQGCRDDLEVCLRVYQDWATAESLPSGHSWKCPRIPKQALGTLEKNQTDPVKLVQQLTKTRSIAEFRRQVKQHLRNPYQIRNWQDNAEATLRNSIKSEWCRAHGVDATIMQAIDSQRADLIRNLGAKKKELEDREIDFAGLDRLRVIMMRTLSDSIFTRSSESQTTHYDPYGPTDENPPILEIDGVSTCCERPPATILAPGPKKRQTEQTAEGEVSVLVAAFVVELPTVLLDRVDELTDLGLANLFREQFPRPLVGSEEDRRYRLHEQLRKKYPAGTLVSCRVKQALGNDLEAEVLEKVGFGHRQPKTSVTSSARSEKRQEMAEHRGQSFSKNRSKKSLSPRVQKDANTELDPMEEHLDAQVGFQRRPKPTANRDHGSDRSAPPIFARLQQFEDAPQLELGSEIVAEVIRHTDLGTAPGLFVSSPPMRDRFRRFQERYQPGDTVSVRVIGSTPIFATEQGLRVREEESRWETIIPPEELAVLPKTKLLDPIPTGSMIPVRVESIDPKTSTARLSNRTALESKLRKVTDGTVYPARVAFVEYTERFLFIYFTLPLSQPEQGIFIPAKALLFREDYQQGHRVVLPFQIGDIMKVEVCRRPEIKPTGRPVKPTPNDRKILHKNQITYGNNGLHSSNRIPLTDLGKLQGQIESPDVIDAMQSLAFSSNELQAEIQPDDLNKQFPNGTTTDGTVLTVGRDGIKLRLPLRVDGIVPMNEVTWWTDRPWVKQFAKHRERLTVVVTGIDQSKKLVYCSLKRIKADPWNGSISKLYRVGSTYEGTVKNVIPNGAFVELEPGLEPFLPNVSMRDYHGEWIDEASDVVAKGNKVRVKIEHHHLSAKKIDIELTRIVDKSVSQEPTTVSRPTDNNPTQAETGWPWDAGENAIPKAKPEPTAQKPTAAPTTNLEDPGFPQNWNVCEPTLWQRIQDWIFRQ